MTPKRTLKDCAYLILTGFTMGCADVVPGVSGGTMAFIMGVYEELIDGIKSFNVELLRKALRFDLRAVLDHIPWGFLLCLGSGIVLAILSLVHFLSWCLANHEIRLYAFFLGLILASIGIVGAHISWTLKTGIAALAGALLAWWIVGLVPVAMNHSLPILFLSAMVAITAMILPGISGSFILLILGQYAFVIESVKTFNLPVIAVFGLGCVTGLMGFSRVLSWLLKHYYTVTVAVLVGFMAGSLRKIWPWKDVLETMEDRHGDLIPIRYRNVLPSPTDGDLWIPLLLAIAGIALMLLLQQVQKKTSVEGVAEHE